MLEAAAIVEIWWCGEWTVTKRREKNG